MANFVSNDNMIVLMGGIADKFASLGGAYKFRGSIAFANLPGTLTQAMAGYVYNLTDDFTTDARFIEGAGKKYKAGTNVSVADLSTYDTVTPEAGDNPSTEGWYEEVSGKYVLSEDTEVVSGKTYYELNVNMKFDVTGSFEDFSSIYAMISGTFNTATAYSTGDVVIYNGALYKFKADHAAGDWDATEVDQTTVAELVTAAEPDSLTTAQVNALLALL
jgi:hypothetical protein